MRDLSRRVALGVLAAGFAAPLRARPRPRPVAGPPEPASAILERFGLGALTAFVVADAASGAIIEGHRADAATSPASTVKIVTALHALDALGAGHRFRTRMLATGPIAAGVLDGDLALVGGGDPVLDTDALGDLAARVRSAGIISVTGGFRVADGALPTVARIDADQPEQAGYNPTISGINLNFNRVFLAWSPGGGGPRLQTSAPGARFDAPAPSVSAEVGGTGPPRHRMEAGRETWTFAPASLGARGSLWLPVRAPAVYSGETFRALAGFDLPQPQVSAAPPPGAEIATHDSEALWPMLRAMLAYSTNLTAEAVGLTATRAPDLAASGAAMTDWARARYGLKSASFANHSGLTDRSAMSPVEMTRVLVAARDGLPAMLRERPLRDEEGRDAPAPGVRVVAKTGTLNFVSALAGYVEGPGPRRRAFAIFAADPAARARILPDEHEDPPGAASWARRARAQEQALLRRWIGMEAA